jgi:flagellar motor protein MotB
MAPPPGEADDPVGRPRRRSGLLVGSVAAFFVASLLTAAWAQQRRRSDEAAPAARVVPDLATTASPTAPTTATTVASAPTPTAAPTTRAPETTVAVPASTAAPVVTTVATTAAPTSEAVTSTAGPAPTTPPASVLGTTALNRELLDALGKGTLPGDKPWPTATFANGRLVVTGAVPDRATADQMVRTAGALASPDLVDDQLTIDASVPAVRYLLVRLFDTPVFDRGTTTLRKDAEPLFQLWGKRLRDEPTATVLLIAHGDGTSTSLAATRGKVAKDRLVTLSGANPERIESEVTAGVATGPRIDFAVPVG